jgi:hypothetical protein
VIPRPLYPILTKMKARPDRSFGAHPFAKARKGWGNLF